MKKLLTIIIVVLGIVSLKAQQDPHFTHYMFNTLEVNPAYAGSRDALTVTGLYRNQWLGFKGAPETFTINAHTPIFKDKVGVGLSLMKDKIGPMDNYSVFADFAYRINLGLSKKARLIFGLKGGINMNQFRLSGVSTRDDLDPEFIGFDKTLYLGNFGFGMYYRSTNFYVGASVPRILENFYNKDAATFASDDNSRQKRHYNLILGSMIKVSHSIDLQPHVLVKIAEASPPELDLSVLLFLANKKFWVGPAFRSSFRSAETVSAIAGFKLFEQLSLGYSFDFSMADAAFKYTAGSHEVMVRYDFVYKNAGKVQNPRYF